MYGESEKSSAENLAAGRQECDKKAFTEQLIKLPLRNLGAILYPAGKKTKPIINK
jgi:hypothetical protein